MNLRSIVLAAAVFSVAFAGQTAQQTGKPGKPAPPANPAPEPAPIQAVFVNPRAPQEGRDPFFPRSMRPYESFQPVTKTAQPVSVTADLRLNGISGTPEHRLAIINNRTFEIGEEGDVPSGADKVRIRCLEVKAESVIIQFVAGGLRREIHLPRRAL